MRLTPSALSSVLFALLAVLPACGRDEGLASSPSPTPPAPELRSDKLRVTAPAVSPDDAAALAAGNLAFGVDLYGRLRETNSGNNFIYSQTSISLALAMLYGGAAGNTAAQMATVLHFTLPPERLHPAFDALDLALTTPPAGGDASAFQLAIANSTWAQEGFPFLPAYLDLLAQSYGAGLYTADFAGAHEAARAAINGWVANATNDMIPELFMMGQITSETRLVLADAVFFHGDWLTPFAHSSPSATFHAPTRDVSVPMMAPAEQNATLWTGSGFSAASLSYVGGTTSMLLLVPDAGTFDAFEAGLTADGLAAMLTPTGAAAGVVQMPKFGFGTASALPPTLEALGMLDAFDPAVANFSAMDGDRDLSVETVVHKAVIAVDEQGTTAAAATGVAVGRTSAVIQPRVLVVDRPFLFFIRHDPTAAILFQGRVVDPSM
jgi:serpin B